MPEESFVDPNWKENFATLREYYEANYPAKYYSFDDFEFKIDPMETMDEIENYAPNRQVLEIKKCASSFNYFCHKYVKITHPKKGLLPFITYKYQRDTIKQYDDHRFCIISKFRQGGLTTVTVIWALWRCLFKLDETLMVVSKTDREAIAAGEIVKRAIEELPSWMAPEMSKNNDHQKIFLDTGCKLFFYTPEAARGRAITYLIIDEAAFIPNMDKFWYDIFPTINTGGNCIVVSTVNGVGNWYEKTYHEAERGENEFHIIEIDFGAHPDYDNPEWIRLVRKQLGEKGFKQEILRDFLGASDSYIPPEIIMELRIKTKDIEPSRFLFPELANKMAKISKDQDIERGALYIWQDPVEGREYIAGVDAAEGVGEKGDNSCIEIIDAMTCEQVAEFYSNSVPMHSFAGICAQIGKIYNTALMVVENEKCGNAVLNLLIHQYEYENLFNTVVGKTSKPGVKSGSTNRPLFLELLQTRLLTRSADIKSKRFVEELEHFNYNPNTNKVEATTGYHDDAIIGLCLALYAQETSGRYLPAGYQNQQLPETHKAQIYESIKKELESAMLPENWQHKEVEDTKLRWDFDIEEYMPGITTKVKRPYDKIFREFGWSFLLGTLGGLSNYLV